MIVRELPNAKNRCKKLYEKARKRGLYREDIHKHIKELYGVESTYDLTLEQYGCVREQIIAYHRSKNKK